MSLPKEFRMEYPHTWRRYDESTGLSTKNVVYGYKAYRLRVSQGNKRYKDGYRGGGPFLVKKDYVLHTPGKGFTGYIYDRYPTGQRKAYGTTSMFASQGERLSSVKDTPTSDAITLNQCASYGPTGWRRARPGNPTASAFVFLGELRDLPTLPLRLLMELKRFRALGSEYLNVQFGWLPFVSDLRRMYETYVNLDTRINQLIRDNKKLIQRSRTLKNDTTVTVTSDQTDNNLGWFVGGSSTWGASQSRRVVTQIVEEKIWFEGAFRYFIENPGSVDWKKRAVAALYGLNPTPSAIYELLPWSWLIDWFVNVGDVISNYSSNAVDNLVAEHAFVMRSYAVQTHTQVTGWCEAFGLGSFTGGVKEFPQTFACASLKGSESKARVIATPYGFGLTYNGLSDYQKSILAALGISRSRF